MAKIEILTTELIRFTVEGSSYMTELGKDGDTMAVHVVQSGVKVASFQDVHAVWYAASGDLIPPEDDD